MMQIHK